MPQLSTEDLEALNKVFREPNRQYFIWWSRYGWHFDAYGEDEQPSMANSHPTIKEAIEAWHGQNQN